MATRKKSKKTKKPAPKRSASGNGLPRPSSKPWGAAGKALDASNFGANAALQAEAQKFGIPASQYATLLGAIAPVAAQFGTNTGHSEGEQQMSGAQQFAMIAQGLGSLWPKGNISFGAS